MSICDDQTADTQRSECSFDFNFMLGLTFYACLILFILYVGSEGPPPLSVHVTSLSISNFSLSDPSGPTPSVTGTWLLTLTIDNNYKCPFSFSGLESHMSYRHNELAMARVSPISVGKWGFTDISITFVALDYYTEPWVAGQMNSDWMSLGAMNFDFTVMYDIYISCTDTPVKFNRNSTGNGGSGSSGELMGIPWNCKVSM